MSKINYQKLLNELTKFALVSDTKNPLNEEKNSFKPYCFLDSRICINSSYEQSAPILLYAMYFFLAHNLYKFLDRIDQGLRLFKIKILLVKQGYLKINLFR